MRVEGVCFLKPRHKKLLLAAALAGFLVGAVPLYALQGPKLATSAGRSDHDEPINVTGDQTIYDSKTDTFTVIGNAVMTQGGSTVTADQIELFRAQRVAIATGNVHLTDPEVEVWAQRAKVNIADETVELDNAKVQSKQAQYKIAGTKIRKLQDQNYEIVSGFFTTCGCSKGAPDWSISAKQMDVQVGGTGTAHDASFDVLGHQLFKLPYANFPADTNRKSGFLVGRQGQSGLRGFQWLQPYFLAINKSSDATVALDVETSQRIGGLGEYRLTNGPDDYFWTNAAYYNESIRSDSNRQSDIVDNQIADDHIPVDRYDLIGMARQHLTPDLTAYGDTIAVSDSLLLRELDVWTLSRGYGTAFSSMRATPSHFGLLDEYDGGYGQLQGTFYQDLIQPQRFALQRLPEALVSGRQDFLGGHVYADYDAEADYMYRSNGQSGMRLALNPRLTVPWRLGDYLYGFGSAGVQGTAYDVSGNIVNIIPVGTKMPSPVGTLQYNNDLTSGPLGHGGLQANAIPTFETGIGTILDRVYDLNWASIEKLKHTMEPFVDYAYVPRIFQGNQPLFDELDRVNARSLVSYGITTRLFGKMSPKPPTEEEEQNANAGAEPIGPYGQAQPSEILAPLGQPTFSRGGEVRELAALTVMNAYDISHEITPTGGKISDLQSILNIYPTQLMSLASEVDYNPRGHAGITYAHTSINFQPPWSEMKERNSYMGRALQGSFVSLGYSYVSREAAVEEGTARNASDFGTLRAYSDIFNWLGLYLAPSYDFASSRLLSAEYGARLKSPCDCWAADFGVTDSFNPNEVRVQVQVTLGGLGSVGSSPFGRNPFQQMGLAGQPTGVLAPAY